MFMTILNTQAKPSEGFSLFSAVNVLWLIKAVRTTYKLNAVGGHSTMEKYTQQPALSTAAEGKSANNCSPY